MKIAYFPGCTLKTRAKNLEDAALAALRVPSNYRVGIVAVRCTPSPTMTSSTRSLRCAT